MNVFEKFRNIGFRANVRDFHGEKFGTRKSITADSGRVYVQNAQALQVIHPDWDRVAVEQQPVLFLCAAQAFFGSRALFDFAKNGVHGQHKQSQEKSVADSQDGFHAMVCGRNSLQSLREKSFFLSPHVRQNRSCSRGQISAR